MINKKNDKLCDNKLCQPVKKYSVSLINSYSNSLHRNILNCDLSGNYLLIKKKKTQKNNVFNQYALQSYKVQLSEPSQEKFAHYILTKHFENVLQVSEGIEAVHHRQRELASFWACQHHLRDKKSDFSSADYEEKERWKKRRQMERWKAQCLTKRSDWSSFRVLSDNRIRLQRRVRCLQFRSPPSLRTTYRGSLQLL